ncbi:MAG: deoxynucleoside kinase [Nitrospinae bacterium]|nr:deoxynucleoside kinase [Nitrospinota bacterium]
MLKDLNYLAIEGPIGAGKTSLALKIGKRLSGKVLLEEVDKNPFLGNFYKEIDKVAFPTQIFFLLNRYRQQQELLQKDLFCNLNITDYMFYRDRLFAYMNLSDEELSLYEELYGMLTKKLVKPDLIIYLDASTPVLLKRIRKRGRDFERNMTEEYLEASKTSLHYFFFHYDESPVLLINTDNADFINNEEQFENLMRKVDSIKGGKNYYNPS